MLELGDDGLFSRIATDHPRGAKEKNNPQHTCSPRRPRQQ
jgi:hypothetical protein